MMKPKAVDGIKKTPKPAQLTFDWPDEREELIRGLRQVEAERDRLRRQVALLQNEINHLKTQSVFQSGPVEMDGKSRDSEELEARAAPVAMSPAILPEPECASITRHSPVEQKIAFYRSLFRERDDVICPSRREQAGQGSLLSQTGMAG